MQFFQPLFGFDNENFLPQGRPIALAIGVFDGVHTGHREIIRTVKNMAEKRNALACALTFDPHPKSIFGEAPLLLMPVEERRRLLLEAGADFTGTISFDRQTAAIEPEDFLLRLVNDSRFRLAGIAVGEHWRFGSRGKGSGKLIEKYAQQFDFEFSAVPELTDDDTIISSSAIRKFIVEGDIERAKKMLGRNPALYGKVERGFGVAGKELETPTANLVPEYGVIPPDGVYAAMVVLDGKRHQAAVNIGVAPTYKVNRRRVEIHLLDWHGSLYGKNLKLEIVKFIRNEQTFPDPQALKQQIFADISKIRLCLNKSELN